jgi:hypothetical protein
MLRATSLVLAPLFLLAMLPSARAAASPDAAGPDFEVQGEYVGTLPTDGQPVKYGVQIIALGKGKFHAVGFIGGLPGDGWDKSNRVEGDGETRDGQTIFQAGGGAKATIKDADSAIGTIKDGVLTVKDAAGTTLGTLKKVLRKSPTQGAKPPAGAVVLFDGTSADKFEGGRMTADGLLMEGATSKQNFQSYSIHLEFIIPFMPEARGQGRGNSGYYSQGRYETQILDSFGLEPKNNECGGIYGIAAPEINVSYPPLSWQTYDVDYTAAEYKDGKKEKNARLTVRHNGVPIHKDLEVPHATTAAPVQEGPEPGPVYLQNHGNPVRFRNVWLVEKK